MLIIDDIMFYYADGDELAQKESSEKGYAQIVRKYADQFDVDISPAWEGDHLPVSDKYDWARDLLVRKTYDVILLDGIFEYWDRATGHRGTSLTDGDRMLMPIRSGKPAYMYKDGESLPEEIRTRNANAYIIWSGKSLPERICLEMTDGIGVDLWNDYSGEVNEQSLSKAIDEYLANVEQGNQQEETPLE